MPRTVKTADERRMEIIKTAEKLFNEKGFIKTSVDSIIKTMGVAKGTFYYYFKSKEEVLKAIVELQLDQIVSMTQQLADDKTMSAMAKMELLLSGSQVGDDNHAEITDHMHLQENRELHEESNIQTVLRLSPIFARIIEQGNEEEVFHVEKPLETFQILLSGGQFLLDGGLFDFTEEEKRIRRMVLQDIVEKSLGAEKGSFGFMKH